MYPEEYGDFSQLLKKYVVLNTLFKVLEYDRKRIKQSNCKLAQTYDHSFEELQFRINKDIVTIKRNLKELGGKVIEEKQQPTVRIVKAKFRGFIYTHRFLNYVLQSETEQLFKAYLFDKYEIDSDIKKLIKA